LPRRATATGNARTVGKSVGRVCGGSGATVALTRPGPTGTRDALHGGAVGGRMAGVVHACHRGSAEHADTRADRGPGGEVDRTFGRASGQEAGRNAGGADVMAWLA